MDSLHEGTEECPFCHVERPVRDGKLKAHNRRTKHDIIRCNGSGMDVSEIREDDDG